MRPARRGDGRVGFEYAVRTGTNPVISVSGAFILPTLHVLQGPDKGRTYDTPSEPAIIGRSSDQIQLTDNSASRRHAEIRPANGTWMLEDLNSSNGTYLNGQRIVAAAELKHGDQIKVGSTLLVFSGQEHIESFSGADDTGPGRP